MTKLLLVEDDPVMYKLLEYHLQQENKYTITWARNAGEALALSREPFDIILLDVMLPDISGIELCEQLRSRHHCPILFISCLDQSDTVISALSAGGDDYIVKPFDTKVLDARIQANLRRVHFDKYEKTNNVLRCGEIALDANTRELIKGDKRYKLVSLEYQVLSFFMQHPGRTYTAGEIYQEVWGKPSYGDVRTVTVHIYNLRQKLEDDPKEPRYLVSEWGKGYTFLPE